jgi:multiple sugar transport system permease protein
MAQVPMISGPGSAISRPAFRRKGVARFLGQDWVAGYSFTVPVFVILLGFVAYPFFSALYLSMTNTMLGGVGEFVGLNNYAYLLGNRRFQTAALNSTILTVSAVGLKMIVGMIVALVLNQALKPKMLWRMLFFLPWSIPVVISAYNWRWIYDDLVGILSLTLIQVGLTEDYILWLANRSLVLKSIIAAEVWQGTPFYIMNFLAGLSSIPTELYEAGEVDGANAIQKFFNITLPSLVPVIIVTALLSTIWTSNSMQMVFVLTKGGPNDASLIFPYLAYNQAIELKQLGLGSAVPLMFFPVFAIIIYFLTRRLLREE